MCRGVDVKKTLNDFWNYSNPDFYLCLPPQLRPSSYAAPPPAVQHRQASSQSVPGSRADRDPAPCKNYEDCIVSWERYVSSGELLLV